jgi:hypothetical protein
MVQHSVPQTCATGQVSSQPVSVQNWLTGQGVDPWAAQMQSELLQVSVREP